MLRTAVIGVGYMGANHALKYHLLDETELVAVVDKRVTRAMQVADELGCRWFERTEDLVESDLGVDAVTIATPTSSHYQNALHCFRKGIHCLVEKPLAENSSLAAKMLEAAEDNSVVLLPGHIERFNPAIIALFLCKPDIQYIKSYRVGPMSFRSIDIDVLLDVMIHDIDISMLLSGCGDCSVDIARAVSSPEGINDIANVHLRIGDRCIADLTASRLAVARRRKLRMYTADGYYSVDCDAKRAMRLSRDRYYAGIKRLKQYQELGREPKPEQIFEALGAERINVRGREGYVDALEAEIQYFVGAIEGKSQPKMLTAEDGVAAIRIVERIRDSLRPESVLVPTKSIRPGK